MALILGGALGNYLSCLEVQPTLGCALLQNSCNYSKTSTHVKKWSHQDLVLICLVVSLCCVSGTDREMIFSISGFLFLRHYFHLIWYYLLILICRLYQTINMVLNEWMNEQSMNFITQISPTSPETSPLICYLVLFLPKFLSVLIVSQLVHNKCLVSMLQIN